jgi:hypothetical protein
MSVHIIEPAPRGRNNPSQEKPVGRETRRPSVRELRNPTNEDHREIVDMLTRCGGRNFVFSFPRNG